jgi:hypothetical protein
MNVAALILMSPLPESNQRPTDYKSVALPAELRRLLFLVLPTDYNSVTLPAEPCLPARQVRRLKRGAKIR